MKQPARKLVMRREVIATLAASELGQVNGGDAAFSIFRQCTTDEPDPELKIAKPAR